MSDLDGAAEAAGSEALYESRGALRRELLIVTLLTVGALVPFINKPVHLDDPLFLWAAEQICETPGSPYLRHVNWGGSVLPMWAETRNPPALSYLFAAVGSLFNWHEAALHGILLLFSVATTWGVYFLARGMTRRPLWAALAALATPVFLVSATTLMCDVPMLCFWVWAVYCWRRGHEDRAWTWLAAGAVLAGLAALFKYFGLSLLPLLAVDGWRRRPFGAWMAWLAVPIVLVGGQDIYLTIQYGHSALGDASAYAAHIHSTVGMGVFREGAVGFSFCGGCMLSAVFFAPAVVEARHRILGIVLAASALLAFSLVGVLLLDLPWETPQGKLWLQLAHYAVFAAAGAWIVWLAARDFYRTRDADGLTLLLWMGGTFVFASVVNWTTNGRSILPMAPALGILIARAMDRRASHADAADPSSGLGAARVAVALGLMLSMLIAWADYAWAAGYKRAAFELYARYAPEDRPLYFDDHWGFQYYMEHQGAQHLDRVQSVLHPGDILITHDLNPSPIRMAGTLKADAEVVGEHAYGGISWINTVCSELGAGFYADFWGPLPWTIGPVPPDRYTVHRIKKRLDPPLAPF